MPTFPRGFVNHLLHVKNAKELERIARETGGNLTAARAEARARRESPFEFPDPVDLRGIPVIGRGIAGIAPGTRPDAITDR